MDTSTPLTSQPNENSFRQYAKRSDASPGAWNKAKVAQSKHKENQLLYYLSMCLPNQHNSSLATRYNNIQYRLCHCLELMTKLR